MLLLLMLGVLPGCRAPASVNATRGPTVLQTGVLQETRVSPTLIVRVYGRWENDSRMVEELEFINPKKRRSLHYGKTEHLEGQLYPWAVSPDLNWIMLPRQGAPVHGFYYCRAANIMTALASRDKFCTLEAAVENGQTNHLFTGWSGPSTAQIHFEANDHEVWDFNLATNSGQCVSTSAAAPVFSIINWRPPGF